MPDRRADHLQSSREIADQEKDARKISPGLVLAGSYGSAGAAMRVRVLDWLRVLALAADVHD